MCHPPVNSGVFHDLPRDFRPAITWRSASDSEGAKREVEVDGRADDGVPRERAVLDGSRVVFFFVSGVLTPPSSRRLTLTYNMRSVLDRAVHIYGRACSRRLGRTGRSAAQALERRDQAMLVAAGTAI